ncbi:phage portal protein, HK97 family [Methylibium sp. T29]|nr:phage portal protein, HK97 family [Methylibium sp. T29]
MKIFGLEITKAMTPVPTMRNVWRVISEPFSGAWQMNVDEKVGDLTTYPTLYACIYRISSDIGKLPFRLRQRDEAGIWSDVPSAAYDPVLRKPNGFQTAGQFREYWLLTKLIQGNATSSSAATTAAS